MTNVIYTADFMAEHVLGGGELNDHELCTMMSEVKRIRCSKLNKNMLEGKLLIISNFVTMPEDIKNHIANNNKYVIYEHDHKYIKNRNPGMYKNFMAPKSEIVNFDFYNKAMTVFCQSSFHKKIIEKNLGIKNVINLSGNLWSEEALGFMESLSVTDKREKYSIMDSSNWHKNTREALFYCEKKEFDHELIKSKNYFVFLKMLSRNKFFIFLPKTPETLSRVVVEAKMMGVKVLTNKYVGATYEDWYKLTGKELVNKMKDKRKEILNNVLGVLHG